MLICMNTLSTPLATFDAVVNGIPLPGWKAPHVREGHLARCALAGSCRASTAWRSDIHIDDPTPILKATWNVCRWLAS